MSSPDLLGFDVGSYRGLRSKPRPMTAPQLTRSASEVVVRKAFSPRSGSWRTTHRSAFNATIRPSTPSHILSTPHLHALLMAEPGDEILTRPQSAASLHGFTHKAAGGVRSTFGFGPPIVKVAPKPVPPPPPPTREQVLRKQIWARLGALEEILLQWRASGRLPSVPNPRGVGPGLDPAEVSSAEAAVSTAARARACAEKALRRAEVGYPSALAAHEAASDELRAAEDAASKKKGKGEVDRELIETAEAAAAELARVNEIISGARTTIEQSKSNHALASAHLSFLQSASSRLAGEAQLRVLHREATRRTLPCRVPYILQREAARIKNQPETVTLTLPQLWAVLIELTIIDPKAEGEKKGAYTLFNGARALEADTSRAPPSPRSTSSVPLAGASVVSLSALRAYVKPPEPKPRVLTPYEKKMNPDNLKAELAQNLGKMMGLFRTWDISGDGEIDREEFGLAVRALGIVVDDDVVEIVFDEHDHDHSGSLEYVEFLRYALRDGLKRCAMRIIDLLRKWDLDNSQSVDRREFRRAIRGIGFDAPPEEVDRLFAEMDADSSGQIDFKELNTQLRQGASIHLAAELQVGGAGEIEVGAKNRSPLRNRE